MAGSAQSDAGPPPVIPQPVYPLAAARSRTYALFSEALCYPQGSNVVRLLDGDLTGELHEALSQCPHGQAPTLDFSLPVGPRAIAELQQLFSSLFDVTGGMPRVSLLERRYGDAHEQKLWQDLLAFYAHFGLDFSRGQAAEQPDHLHTELGFMHYLSFLHAGMKQVTADLIRAQRDFLKLHLQPLTRGIAEQLATVADAQPYTEIAADLAIFVENDLVALENDTELGSLPTETNVDK